MVHTAEALAQATDEAERKTLAARYDRLNELLRHHDAYNVDHHVEHVLDGLGFRADDYDRPVDTFSGGQQSRLMLAKLLLAAPDVMLLDEPSNHLDIATTRWLEDYLAKQPEAMLIVSHDRYFLDKVVTKVFELHQRQHRRRTPATTRPTGGCARSATSSELKAWEVAAGVHREAGGVHSPRPLRPAAQAGASRGRRQLDRLERVERPTLIEAPHMHFGEVRRSGDVVLQVDDLTKAYDRPLFADLSFDLHARPAARHHGPQRQRQDDAAAHPARRRGAGRRHGAARPPRRVRLLRPAPASRWPATSR